MSAQLTLQTAVSEWERRRKWGVILENLPYALLPGLAVGAGLTLYSRFRPGFSDTVNLSVALGGAVIGVVGLFAFVWLRRRSPVESARWFDLHFGLQERVSTALELIDGRIKADESLLEHQVSDAQHAVSKVDAPSMLPLTTDGRIWILDLAFLALLAFLLLVTSPVIALDSDRDAERAAISQAAADVSDIIEDIAADPTLTDEQREPLLEALTSQLETLRDPNLTLDEALATLGEVESTLSESAETIQQQIQQQELAEAAASAAMQTIVPDAETQSLADNLQAIDGEIEQMTPEQMQAAAQTLEEAADAIEQTNPEAAEAMREAAEALREGDMQAAREAMQQAMSEAERAQSERGQQAEAQSQMQQSASQVQSAQQQAAQQGQSEQQGQQGEGEGAEGEQSGGQQGDGTTGQLASEGSTEGQGSTSALAPSESAAQSESNSEGQLGRGGEGMGDGQGAMDQDASAARQQQSSDQQNNPDGAGEARYEAVFAPRFSVEAAGSDEVSLGADPGEAPLTEGEFQDNPFGASVVPYNQVFSSYADAASRALESDYIPLGMRDVIRDYFSSLDPQQ